MGLYTRKHAMLSFDFLVKTNPALAADPSGVSKLFVINIVIPCGNMGGLLKQTKLTSSKYFSNNLFDDKSKLEILQIKMAKIALTVHKKSCIKFGCSR